MLHINVRYDRCCLSLREYRTRIRTTCRRYLLEVVQLINQTNRTKFLEYDLHRRIEITVYDVGTHVNDNMSREISQYCI